MNHAHHQSNHTNVDTLLSRLERVSRKGNAAWSACCPAHQDKSPSLSIRSLPDGRTLIHCFGGCGPLDVLSAIGLDWDALYPDEAQSYGSIIRDHNLRPRTVDDYVVDLAKNTNTPLSDADRTRAKQALLRGGEEFGWVKHVKANASKEDTP